MRPGHRPVDGPDSDAAAAVVVAAAARPAPTVRPARAPRSPRSGWPRRVQALDSHAEVIQKRSLILQRQLGGCLSAGAVVRGAGLSLASSAPPGPVGGVVKAWPRGADEGVEQAPELGHGQRDELLGSGCTAPFSAVARVADR